MRSDVVNEKAENIYNEISENLKKQTELEFEFLEHQVEFYKELLEVKEEEEPLKLFKKSYNKWLIERNEIKRKLMHSEKELDELKISQRNSKKDYCEIRKNML